MLVKMHYDLLTFSLRLFACTLCSSRFKKSV